MNKLSTDDARELKEKIYDAIQTAPRRMKEFEIGEAVLLAYKQALGITTIVTLEKDREFRECKKLTVYSIGKDPKEAILNFFMKGREDPEYLAKVVKIKEPLERGKEEYSWGFYITVDGTGCKAAGTYISGYAVLTWWK